MSQCVQAYFSDCVALLSKAMGHLAPDSSVLLARFFYLRGAVHLMQGQLLDALLDFQSLYKTDLRIFPADLVRRTLESMSGPERAQAERVPELRRLISEVADKPGDAPKPDDRVKHFELPKKHMQLDDFVKRVQESGIVKDANIINRLFEALTVGKRMAPAQMRGFGTPGQPASGAGALRAEGSSRSGTTGPGGAGQAWGLPGWPVPAPRGSAVSLETLPPQGAAHLVCDAAVGGNSAHVPNGTGGVALFPSWESCLVHADRSHPFYTAPLRGTLSPAGAFPPDHLLTGSLGMHVSESRTWALCGFQGRVTCVLLCQSAVTVSPQSLSRTFLCQRTPVSQE